MSQHYLGIDVGTTAVKALVVDESPALSSAMQRRHRSCRSRNPDGRNKTRRIGGGARSTRFVPHVRASRC